MTRSRLWLPVLVVASLLVAGRASSQGDAVDIEADRLVGSRGPEGEIVLLEGNVVLRRGTTTVRSQQGRWLKDRRLVTLMGGVTADDGTLRITSDQADYDDVADRITLTGTVHVTDRNLEARSPFASYDAKARTAEMWGGVQGSDRGRRLKADRVTYVRDRQFATALGNVWGTDSTGTLVLTATHADFDRKADRAHATGAPRLTRNDKGRLTTLLGDTLTLDSSKKIAWADGHVRVTRDTLSAEGEHAVYWDDEDRGLLTGSPVARNGEVTATGDSIEVFTKDGEIARSRVRGHARIDFESRDPAERGEKNSLTAERIDVYFSGSHADSLYAEGDAENLYAGAPKTGKLPETNRAKGDQVRVYFSANDVDRALLTGRPSGEYRFELDAADSARAPTEVVRYEGNRIEFRLSDRRIRIDHDAKLRYQNLALSAGRVDFDSRKQTLVAREKPVLKDNDEELAGRTMTYDLEKRSGTVYEAATQYDNGFYRGEAIHRSENDILQVRGASYSTCDLAQPHYHVAAGRMKIMLRDKIVARPVVFYLKQIPVFFLPFYILPIKPDRHSGFLFPQLQFGFSGASGRFIRNAGYYYAPNDYMDFSLSGDYYEREPAWVGRAETRYRYQDRVVGQIDARYTDSRAFLGSRQYEVNLSHNQTLDPATRLTAEGHFTSSRDFTRDPRTGEPLANRLDRFLVSSLDLNRRFSWGAADFVFSRNQDLDANPISSPLPKLTQNLPGFTVTFYQRALGRAAAPGRPAFLPGFSSLYYNYSLRGVNRRETRSVLTAELDTTVVDGVVEVNRGVRDSTSYIRAFLGQGGLSDNRHLFGFLNVSPSFGSTQVLYEKDVLGQRWQPAAVYNLAVGTSATFYGTFHPRIGPVTGIRHVLFPQLSFFYQPDFTSLTYVDSNGVRQNRFPPVSGIAISGFRQRQINYSLQHRIQMRLKKGEGTLDLPNLLTVVSGGTYDFLWRQHQLASPWRPLTTTVRLQPPGYFSLNGNLIHSFDAKPYFRSVAFSGDLRLVGKSGTQSSVADLPLAGNEAQVRQEPASGPWNVNLAYSYTAGRDAAGNWKPSQTLNSFATLSPTKNWHLNYYNTVDLTRGGIVAQEYSVTRDLHCWRAQFVRRFAAREPAEYYFRIAILSQQEIYLERGSRGLGSFSGF